MSWCHGPKPFIRRRHCQSNLALRAMRTALPGGKNACAPVKEPLPRVADRDALALFGAFRGWRPLSRVLSANSFELSKSLVSQRPIRGADRFGRMLAIGAAAKEAFALKYRLRLAFAKRVTPMRV